MQIIIHDTFVTIATLCTFHRYSDESINEGLFALFLWKHLECLHVFFSPLGLLGKQYIYMFIDIGTHVIKSHGTYIVLLYGDSSSVLY